MTMVNVVAKKYVTHLLSFVAVYVVICSDPNKMFLQWILTETLNSTLNATGYKLMDIEQLCK